MSALQPLGDVMQIALTLFMFLYSCNMEDVMTKPARRNVLVQTEDGRGSGVLIASNLVLTCFHLVSVGSDLRVNGKPAIILKVDPKNDLMLLTAEVGYASILELAQSGNMDEEIIIYGNPLKHLGMVLRGRIVDIDGGFVYTDAHIFFGSSGGGAYNKKGELIGIVSAIETKVPYGSPYGIIIPAPTIFDFLVKKP